jgi:hypothetical protein
LNWTLNDCIGLLAAVSRIAAILPNNFAPTNMNGPLLPFTSTSGCCGAARRTGLSLQPHNFRWANSRNADEAEDCGSGAG